MTREEFIEKYNNDQLREIARDIAGSVVIRDYVNGCSRNTRRETTSEEKEVIRNIVMAALISYRFRSCNGSIDAILDMAEFTLRQFILKVNTYDSVYIPLRKVTETW